MSFSHFGGLLPPDPFRIPSGSLPDPFRIPSGSLSDRFQNFQTCFPISGGREANLEASLEGREASLEGREASLEGREANLEGREANLEGREAKSRSKSGSQEVDPEEV